MVSEYGESMCGEGTGRNMEDGRKHFAGDLVHVRNHEQEALRCCVGGGKHTCLEGAVHCSRGTGLAFQLSYADCFSPEILFAVGCPLVDVLCHRR